MAMEFAPELDDIEVPDPYFSNIAGFERVFKMLEVAMKGVVQHIRQNNQNNNQWIDESHLMMSQSTGNSGSAGI